MKKLCRTLLGLVVLCFAGGYFTSVQSQPLTVRYGTSSMGGPAYLTGVVWAEAMNKHLGKRVAITAEVTSGSTVNIQLLEKGEQDIGIGSSIGEYQFSGQKNVRSLWVFWPIMSQYFVLADSDIYNIQDLEGKSVSGGVAAIPSTWLAKQTLETLGIKAHFRYMAVGELDARLKDGVISAILSLTGYPQSPVISLETTKKLRFIELSEQDRAKILKKFTFISPMVVPAGTYKALTKDYHTYGVFQTQVCRAGMPEDIIYELTKTTIARWEELKSSAPILRLTDPVRDVKYCVSPLHPGALRAYKEKGAQIPNYLIPPELK
jgi:TRAP transporter TAXI family solute receptor